MIGIRPLLSLGLKDLNFQSDLTGTQNFYTDSLIATAPDTIRAKGPAVPFELHSREDFTTFELGLGLYVGELWTNKIPFPIDTHAGFKAMGVKGTQPSLLIFLSFVPKPAVNAAANTEWEWSGQELAALSARNVRVVQGFSLEVLS